VSHWPMPVIGTAFALGFFMAGTAMAEELRCEGAFSADSSEARLIEVFGPDNVVTGEVPGPEGTTMIATTVYPGDPERSFIVTWWDETSLSLLANATLPPSGAGPGGVHVGMDVAEVEALNGEPFTMLGFDWDYGGSAGFESGALAGLPGGCRLGLVFEATATLPPGTDADPISGDREVPSNLPLLRQVQPRVAEVWIGYPHPDYAD
jgi:hypothetical protein